MRLVSLLLIASCASTPPAQEPAPPAPPVPDSTAAAPAGPPLPPPPPTGGAPHSPPPPIAAPPTGSPTAAPPTRPPAAAPPTGPAAAPVAAGGLPVARGTRRADVRAAFGTADPTGAGFDTFGAKGLVIGYHEDLVDTVTATTLAVGTTYRDRVLGVAIGDTVDHANATWGPPVSTSPGSGDYGTATYQTGAYRVAVEIWSKDGKQGGSFGAVRARTIKRIEVTRR
ncbi:MAG: hypothetical protein JNL83_26170 [Myxococcales bacterium]|nr:hypothetical protein [Myxococcales bacterium]